MNGVLIAALHKSSGKTMVTLGLAAAMTARGINVQTFKKGPDYIDPMWLGRAACRPCLNLDFHTMIQSEIETMFFERSADADLAVVEGNKGLFDGVNIDGSDSNAALATQLGLPVVLVVDTRGMTRGIAPVILGYQAFGSELRISGVILNQVGGMRHEGKLRAAIEHYTDVAVLGAIGSHPEMKIAERHLGLVPANEDDHVAAIIKKAAAVIEAGVNLELVGAQTCVSAIARPNVAKSPSALTPDVRIGIARDAAFGFYYPDDLEALHAAGAELVAFDTLDDSALPEVDGLFIGGGFPETQAAQLSANTSLRQDIGQALAAGMPAYAECGGLMYLSQALTWNGQRYEMVGAIPGETVMHMKPVGRGYVRLRETRNFPWSSNGGIDVPVHEFHYASLENLPADMSFAYEVMRGHGIDGKRDGLIVGNLMATFSHQRNVIGNPWAERFVGFVRAKSGD